MEQRVGMVAVCGSEAMLSGVGGEAVYLGMGMGGAAFGRACMLVEPREEQAWRRRSYRHEEEGAAGARLVGGRAIVEEKKAWARGTEAWTRGEKEL
jgi:hypothetical protein